MRFSVMRWAVCVVVLMVAVVVFGQQGGVLERVDPADLPGVEVDVEAGWMDLKGVVVQQKGLLELAVTTRGGKEHEAVFAVEARADHVHLGLLMLGVNPGSTGAWRYVNNEPMPIDPTGGRVAISVVRVDDAGGEVERPISDYIINRVDNTKLPSSEFVFAGGRMNDALEGRFRYMANGTGDLVTLVSFPERDEVLAYPKAASDENDRVTWVADETVVPEVGTEVRVRIRRMVGEAEEAGEGE